MTNLELWGDLNGLHIRAFRDFTEPKSKFHLTPNEFYIYSLINLMERTGGSALLSISIIDQLLPLDFFTNSTRNRKAIISLLEALRDKKVIVSNIQDFKVLKANTLFTVSVNEEYINENAKIKGYFQLPAILFLNSSKVIDLFIYSVVCKWQLKREGFKCSYSRWGEILSLSRRSAITHIKSAVEREVIYQKQDLNGEHNVNVYTVKLIKNKKRKGDSDVKTK